MPSKTKEKNIAGHSLLREPLGKPSKPLKKEASNMYPVVSEEKKNLGLSSSGESQGQGIYPSLQSENNSSPTKFKQGEANVARRRSDRHQDKQVSRSQDGNNKKQYSDSSFSEGSDVNMETEEFVKNNSLHNQRQEASKNSQAYKNNPYMSSEYIPEASLKARSKGGIFPKINPQNMQSSIDASNSTNSYLESLKYLILGLVIILLGYILFSYFETKYNATNITNDVKNATFLVSSLRSGFKDQPPLTFHIIGSALNNVLKDKPVSPAIILLLATNGSRTVCDDFAQRLVDSLKVPKYTVTIPGEKYKQANSNEAKLEIDKIIKEKLNTNHMGAVLIKDLDLIPGQAALILHKYYDHENAFFKKALFVMTADFNKPINDYSSTKVWDKAANDHLLSVWTDAGIDQLTALLSRLTVSVAIITSKTQ